MIHSTQVNPEIKVNQRQDNARKSPLSRLILLLSEMQIDENSHVRLSLGATNSDFQSSFIIRS